MNLSDDQPEQQELDSPGVAFDAPRDRKVEEWTNWFAALTGNTREIQQALADDCDVLQGHAKLAVQSAAAAGSLPVLIVLQDELGIHCSVGGGAAVRAAAKHGHLEILQWFQEHGLQPEEGQRWAARTAAENGHLKALKWLWDNGLSNHFRAGGGIVRGAAQGAQLEVLRWVEESGLSIVEGGAWSVRLAAHTGNLDVMRWLFEHGMSPQEHGASALRGAAAGGHLEVLKWLVELEGVPSVQSCGRALVWAVCEGGHLQVLQWLQMRGVRAVQGGGAAVWAAARRGHLHMLQWLNDQGLPPAKGGSAVVRAAVKGGFLDVLVWLAKNGLDVSDGGSFCGPGTAAEKGHLEVLQWLVGRGMQLERVGASVAIGAAKGGHLSVLRWLHRKGVEVAHFAQKAVQEAAAGGHLEVLDWLVMNEARVSLGGWEAVQAASVGGHLDILRWLLGHGLSVKEHSGAAVAGAAKGGHIHILVWLADEGVDLERHASAAVQEAAAYGHVMVLRWLQSQDINVAEGGRKAICRAAEGGHLEALRWLVHDGGIDLRFHWRAAVWVAAEAAQPDVHNWLLQEDQYSRVGEELGTGPVSLTGSSTVNGAVSQPVGLSVTTGRSMATKSTGRGMVLPTDPRSSMNSGEQVSGQAHGLKWMLQYTLDRSEGIQDNLTVAACEGHMETLDWVSTVTEPHWTVKLAIKNGHLSCLQWIVKNGLSLRSVEERAVRWAAEAGRTDVLKWLKEKGAPFSVSTMEAAAGRGKSTALELLRRFELPLSQHPSLAEDLLPYFSNVSATLLANFILVPCSAAEEALEQVLVETRVLDHRGNPLKRATLQSGLAAATFRHTPLASDLQAAIAPSIRTRTYLLARDVPVKFFHLPVLGAISPVVLRALAVTPRLPVYDTLAAQAIVLAAWQKVRTIYICEVLTDFMQLLAVLYITAELKPGENTREAYTKDHAALYEGGWDSDLTRFCLLLLLAIWTKAVVGETLRYRAYRQRGWGWDLACLSEAWEFLCFGVMGIFLTTTLFGTQTTVSSPLLSVVGFTRWWKVLYSLRGFDYFGRRVLPILGAFRQILPFTLVMICYGGALAHAFYALSHEEMEKVVANFYSLGIIGAAEDDTSLWGSHYVDAASSPWWKRFQQVWFIAASFLFTVALMNIFIAIMSSAFEDKEEQSNADFLRCRANLCLGYSLCYEGAAAGLWRVRALFRPLQSPPPLFAPEDEIVWLCHEDVPKNHLDRARSVRQMVGFANEQLLTETDARLRAHEKAITATVKEQLRQHRLQMNMLMNPGHPMTPPHELGGLQRKSTLGSLPSGLRNSGTPTGNYSQRGPLTPGAMWHHHLCRGPSAYQSWSRQASGGSATGACGSVADAPPRADLSARMTVSGSSNADSCVGIGTLREPLALLRLDQNAGKPTLPESASGRSSPRFSDPGRETGSNCQDTGAVLTL